MRALIGCFCALCLLLAGQQTMAQAISIRSGDHVGFTRLVARVGADRDWQMTRTGDSVLIRFTPDAPGFDLSGVFTLIGRNRLTEISAGDGLRLDLACACTVTLERYQDQFLIIDINDTPYSPSEPEPEVAAAPPSAPTPDGMSAPQLRLPLLIEAEAAPDPSQLPPAPLAAAEFPGIDITDAGNALAEQLARATAAGLLDIAPGQPFASADPDPAVVPPEPEPSEATPPDPHPPAPEATVAPPLEMANAFDLNANSVPERLIPPATTSCIAPPARPVADWSDGMSFANGIGALRVGLYDDRGQLVAGQAQLLAEFYLYHGFGAEAAFWLSQAGLDTPFHAGLAQYLEQGRRGTLGSFDMQDSCAPAMAFWLFLTAPSESRPDEEVRARILADFYALPAILRDFFGPDLARNFVETGDDAAAMEVRENLGRGGRLPSEALTLLDLDLAEAAPGLAAPTAPPAHVSASNAASAMTHRLRAQIETDGRADPADLIAAEALILETDPQPDRNGLVHVTALAHALDGNLDPIMQHLSATMQRDADAAMPIFTDVVDILMDQDQTAQLLILLSSPQFGQFGHFPSPAYRRQVAEYFLSNGLPDLARDVIMAGGTDRAADREILTRAFERLTRDGTDRPAPDPGIAPVNPPPAPATGSEEITTLLEESRARRAAVQALLTTAEPGS